MSKSTVGLVNAATPTPLGPDGTLDRASVKKLAQRWIGLGLDGVMVLGTMGEGRFLSDVDRDAMLELSLAHAGDQVTVFATVADLSRARMIERAKRSAQLGAPIAVVCVPPGAPAKQAIADVRAVADAAPIPVAYYDIPENTGVKLVLEQVLEILTHPNIVAMKDSSGNPLLAQALTSTTYRPKNMKLLVGNEYAVTPSQMLGYDGVLHGGGALTGKHVRQIWELAATGKYAQALAEDRANSLCLGRIYNRFSTPLQNVLGQKYALHLLGAMDHAVTVDGAQLDDASKARVKAAVDEYRAWLTV